MLCCFLNAAAGVFQPLPWDWRGVGGPMSRAQRVVARPALFDLATPRTRICVLIDSDVLVNARGSVCG